MKRGQIILLEVCEEKESRFGWWDGIRPVTPAPYRDEDVEEEEDAKSKDLQRKKEFIERMKKRKLEAEKEKEASNEDQETAHDKDMGEKGSKVDSRETAVVTSQTEGPIPSS